MPRVTLDFDAAFEKMREHGRKTLRDIDVVRKDLTELGLPSEDAETLDIRGELSQAHEWLDNIESLVKDQISRNRPLRGRRPPGRSGQKYDE